LKKFSLYTIILILSVVGLKAQKTERSKLITAYVYSMAKNIQWPNDLEQFKIHVISRDENIKKEFIKLIDNRKVNGIPMSLHFTDNFIGVKNAQIVYLDNEFNEGLVKLYDKIKGFPVLLISDNFDDRRYIMINFLQAEARTLGFEINRTNILNQDLEILDDDMVLLGGTEIDVAELYKASQDSLRKLELEIFSLESDYDILEQQIQNSQKLIRTQRKKLNQQSQEIESKQDVINEQKKSLDNLLNEVKRSELELKTIARKLDEKEKNLQQLQADIQEQSEELKKGNRILEKQTEQIDEQDQQIKEREKQLEEMSGTVSDQKQALTLLIGFSILILGFVVLLLWAYRARKRDAKKLADQKERLTRLLDELHETQSQLVQSEKMASLGVLTSGIAHEINNAINFVYSGIQIIENKFEELKPFINQLKDANKQKDQTHKTLEQLFEDEQKIEFSESSEVIQQMIQNVLIGAERTAEIVKGLRTFSRSGSDQLSHIDVHQELDVALLLLQGKNRDENSIEKDLKAKDRTIFGYQGQLGQAFLNIIGNAFDAIEDKGRNGKVTIKTMSGNGNIEIKIRDNGHGMDKETRDKVFDPFFTTKEIGKGTGLGLSITYGIIEKHEGNIELSSTKGIGTEFRIILPLAN